MGRVQGWIRDHIRQLLDRQRQTARADFQWPLKLRISLITAYDGQKYYAEYTTFVVEDEAARYLLYVTGYSGTAPDCMHYCNKRKFTTTDRDNDDYPQVNCADLCVGGVWFAFIGGGSCSFAYINCANSMIAWYQINGSPRLCLHPLLQVSEMRLIHR